MSEATEQSQDSRGLTLTSRARRISLSWVLGLAIGVITFLAIGSSLLVGIGAARRAARDAAAAQLALGAQEISNSVDVAIEALAKQIGGSVADPLIRARLAHLSRQDESLGLAESKVTRADLEEANRYFRSVKTPLFTDHALLLLLDRERQLIYQSGGEVALGEAPDLRAEFLDQMESEGLAVSLLSQDSAAGRKSLRHLSEPLLLLGRPIVVNEQVLGYVVVADPASPLFEKLAELQGVRIEIQSADGELQFGEDFDPEHGIEEQRELRIAGDFVLGQLRLSRDLRKSLRPFMMNLYATGIPAAFGVSLLAFAAAVVLARRLSRPIREMRTQVRKVRGGDLQLKLSGSSIHEIQDLETDLQNMVDGLRQRDLIKSTFQRYLPPHVIETLLADPESAELGGRAEDITILFIDLANFTAFSERLAPGELVGRLNEFFESITSALVAEGATLGSYTGDGLVAFFGAPLRQADHAARAVRAAERVIESAETLFGVWRQAKLHGSDRLGIRIGLNSGEVIVGNVGSQYRQDYTAIGDNVNLASRLEGANKAYGSKLLLSSATYLAAREHMPDLRAQRVDRIRVKGRAQALEVFVLSQSWSVDFEREFQSCLELFDKAAYAEAHRKLVSIADHPHTRQLIELWQRRALSFSEQPPPEFDGAFQFEKL